MSPKSKHKKSAVAASAGELLAAGKVIAFPTETFFGLGVSPSSYEGASELLRLKGRLPGIGVPLIIKEASFIDQWVSEETSTVVEKRHQLQNAYWPGPLTLVFRPRDELIPTIHPMLLGPDATLAVRVSSHPIASELAGLAGGIITATSANPHGEEPPTTAEEVSRYFPELLVVADGSQGKVAGMQPSTMVDVRQFPFAIMREGAIPANKLQQWI